jgi:plasmid maintenance system antidote protein VapI
MTQRELALRTGMAPKTINEIINGKAPITPATSILLERVTGIPARMWNNLESNYREQLALKADRDRLRRELDDTKAQLEACEIWRDRLRVEAAKARQTECPNCDRLQRELDEARAQVAKGKP